MGGVYYAMGGVATPSEFAMTPLLNPGTPANIATPFQSGGFAPHPNLIPVLTDDGKTVYRFDTFDTVENGITAWSYGQRAVLQCTTRGNGLEFDDITGIPSR
jgi:hypothetical protein